MALSVQHAEYIISAPSLKHCPEWDLPEIALVGRSNVGKSSLINRLLGRKNLARTSNTPGKTRHMNFYKIDDRFSFVDLPGYGYAKVSKSTQQEWQRNFERYLRERENLILVIQLIDARHEPQKSDDQMLAWLEENDLPTVVVLTKADKIPKSKLDAHVKRAAQTLQLEADQFFLVSAETGYGKDKLARFLSDLLIEVETT